MTKLLIVDDSALMRRHLTQIFTDAGGFEIRQARSGLDAVDQNREFHPDVVTLDINMPVMDGITALSLMMAERPVPVVMVSSLTEQGAIATFEALNLGAVDYVTKPNGTISLSIEGIREVLVAKVRAAARARLKQTARAARVPNKPAPRQREPAISRGAPDLWGPAEGGLVIIGVSTGGPRTLEEILSKLPANFSWPVLIAQHMPAAFTKTFAERLNTCCALRVVEASHPMPVETGTVYIGKGGTDMVVSKRAGRLHVLPKPENPQFLWHPSVELLGRTVLEHCEPTKVTAVMLTGMGNDGSDAFAEIRKRGGRTIAESEQSAVVFGMPAELIRIGGANMVLPADKIASQVALWAGR